MRASVSVSQCFRHVGTCVQLLSPLIFCLVSVLSGISTWRNGTPISEEKISNQTQTQFFFSGYQGRSIVVILNTTQGT